MPSPYFRDNFSGVGGISLECDCGRYYFDDSKDTEQQWDWNEGELAQMQQWLKDEPTKCFAVDGCVSGAYIGTYFYVWDCACNYADKVEDLIWGLRGNIEPYLEQRARAERVAELMLGESLQ
jgi:hypothetical protein